MLAIGLIIGGLFIWLTNRTKLKYEYDRARAEIDTERATLAERLSGKEEQVRTLREALDHEVQQRMDCVLKTPRRLPSSQP